MLFPFVHQGPGPATVLHFLMFRVLRGLIVFSFFINITVQTSSSNHHEILQIGFSSPQYCCRHPHCEVLFAFPYIPQAKISFASHQIFNLKLVDSQMLSPPLHLLQHYLTLHLGVDWYVLYSNAFVILKIIII